jgi:hypothetical protein
MGRLAAATILAGLAMTGAAAAQAPSCQLQGLGTVEMHVTDNKVTLPVTIGGVQREFEFNLAGVYNRLTWDTAEALNLRGRSANMDNTSLAAMKRVVVPELVLGNVKLKTVDFLVFPADAKGENVRDQVSVGMFGKVDLDLDMAAKRLNFFSQDHCPGKAVYWTQDFSQVPFEVQEFGFVRPTFQLDGKPVIAALNLNYPSTMAMGWAHEIFGLDENSPGMSLVETPEKGPKIYRYPFKSLDIDQLHVANPVIRIIGTEGGTGCNGNQRIELPDPKRLRTLEAPQLMTCFGGAGLQLGHSLLTKLHTYFSMKEKILYLSTAAAH